MDDEKVAEERKGSKERAVIQSQSVAWVSEDAEE